MGLIASYAGLTSMALACIYVGSAESIKRLKSNFHKKPKRAAAMDGDGNDDDGEEDVAKPHYNRTYQEFSDPEGPPDDEEEEDEEDEVVSANDAYMFPVYGSATLFGLYLIFKLFEPAWVNLLLRTYMALLGVGGVTGLFVLCVKRLTGIKLPQFQFNLVYREKSILFARFTALHIASLAVASVATGFYLYSRHWLLNNLLAIAFSVSAISLIRLDSFKTGMILLAGLFVYDVFWVFGTDVMVSVAKNFDAPIKVLFPKVFTLNPSAKELTLLGLGDIVIPGIFIALAYRYDRHSYLQSIGYDRSKPLPAVLNGRHLRFPFPAPYFRATFAAYVAGLSTTFAVMHLFKAAQPALLYLSPACILAVLGTAFLRNELGAVMAFTEEHDDDKDDNKKEAKGKKAAGGGGMPTRPKHKAISSISAEATTQSSAQISQGEEADDEQEGVKPGHVLDEKINPVTDTVSRASSRADMAGPPSSPKAKKRTTKKKSKK